MPAGVLVTVPVPAPILLIVTVSIWIEQVGAASLQVAFAWQLRVVTPVMA
jgi:hypothetical protein